MLFESLNISEIPNNYDGKLEVFDATDNWWFISITNRLLYRFIQFNWTFVVD